MNTHYYKGLISFMVKCEKTNKSSFICIVLVYVGCISLYVVLSDVQYSTSRG